MIKTVYELIDEYFYDKFSDEWYDNVWDEINKNWIKEVLDENNEEYNDEIIEDIFKYVLDYQKEVQQSEKEIELGDLKQSIINLIDESRGHYDNDSIGKVLVSLANNYFNGYYIINN